MSYELDGHPASQCEGKERYATSTLANKVLARRQHKSARLTTYHCPHCGGWHIGNRPYSRDLNHRRDEARRSMR